MPNVSHFGCCLAGFNVEGLTLGTNCSAFKMVDMMRLPRSCLGYGEKVENPERVPNAVVRDSPVKLGSCCLCAMGVFQTSQGPYRWCSRGLPLHPPLPKDR